MITLELPWPPSNNVMHRRVVTRGRVVTLLSEDARKYHKRVSGCILEQMVGKPMPNLQTGRLAVILQVLPPDNRRRDLDNLPKAVLDAITKAGLWDDDSQIDQLTIIRRPKIDRGLILFSASKL